MKSNKLLVAYLLLLPIAIGIMYCIYSFGKQHRVRDYEDISQEGVLRIITEYNPLGYYISGDTVKGFQYELSKAISDISGLKVELNLNMNLSKSFEILLNNKCDIIAQNIPVTSQLKELCLFTDPILLSKQVLVQRKANANNNIEPVRDHLKLAKKQIYVPLNSPAILRIQNLEYEIGDTIYIVEDKDYSDEQLIIKVSKGEIDYAACDYQIATSVIKEFPEIDISTDISFTQLQAWAVRKNSPTLLDSLNHWLTQIHKNGQFDKIYKRYYKANKL